MPQLDLTPVSLEQYALVLCATDEGASLEIAVEMAAVSPRDWPAAEAWYAARLSLSPADPSILSAFDEAMRAARAFLARPVTPIDHDVALWGRWLRVWSCAPDPLQMLARSGMDVADVARLSTSWGERLKEDRALAETFAAEMSGSSPAPDVVVTESPRFAAARAAVAARAPSPSAPAQDSPSRPSLMGPLPGELAPSPPPHADARGLAHSPVAPVRALVDPPGPESHGVPSFMAPRPGSASPPALSRPAVSPPVQVPVGSRTAPLPVFAQGTPVIASAPLPFDPNARPEQMPSRGQQFQSGLTGDVDISAIARKVLAFHSPGAAAPPKQDASPAAPSTPIGETTDVDVAALARQALSFAPQKKEASPPVLRAPVPPSPTAPPRQVSMASPPVAPAQAAAPPVAPPAVAAAWEGVPTVPALTAEQYASLCVDLEMAPTKEADILRRYGTNEAGKRVMDEGWAGVFSEQPARRAAFEQAKVAYRTWLSQRARR